MPMFIDWQQGRVHPGAQSIRGRFAQQGPMHPGWQMTTVRQQERMQPGAQQPIPVMGMPTRLVMAPSMRSASRTSSPKRPNIELIIDMFSRQQQTTQMWMILRNDKSHKRRYLDESSPSTMNLPYFLKRTLFSSSQSLAITLRNNMYFTLIKTCRSHIQPQVSDNLLHKGTTLDWIDYMLLLIASTRLESFASLALVSTTCRYSSYRGKPIAIEQNRISQKNQMPFSTPWASLKGLRAVLGSILRQRRLILFQSLWKQVPRARKRPLIHVHLMWLLAWYRLVRLMRGREKTRRTSENNLYKGIILSQIINKGAGSNAQQSTSFFHIKFQQAQTMIDRRELATPTKRNTTDLTCLVLFVAFTIAMLIAALYAYFKGSIAKFSIPHDSDGKGCGIDYPNHPYIYFPSPQYDSLWVTTCVRQCPSQDHSTVDCKINSAVPACVENNSPDNTKAFHVYSTEVYRGSVCLPKQQTIREKVLAGVGARTIEEMFGSVIKDWSLFLLIGGIALGMALAALLLIRLTAGYVIYVLYGLAVAAFVGFGVYMLVPSSDESFLLKKSKIVAYVLAFLSFFLSLIILCVFCSYRERIKAAVEYINQSNQFFKNNYIILILPFILAGFTLLFLYFWIFLSLAFYSISESLPFEHYKLTPLVFGLLLLSLFYLIWGILFLMHSGRFIVSGTVVNWQFKRESPYLTSSKNYLLAHLGSVCMGSFLTALLGAFKFQLDEADCAQRERESQPQNRCIDCLKRCYGCFCCCCIAFIFRCFHHSAYAYQNLSGLPYCQSSTEIYELVCTEREKWSIVAFLYMIFDEFIPLVLAILNILIANAIIQSVELFQANTSNRLLVFFVVGFITFAITHYFISIYSETIQTLFVVEQFHNHLLPNKEDYPLELQPQVVKHSSLPSERYHSSLPSVRNKMSIGQDKSEKVAPSERQAGQRYSLFGRQ